jgi:hypothetical protein
MGFGDPMRLAKVPDGSSEVPGHDLVDAKAHQGGDDHIVVSGRSRQREYLLLVG